MSRITEFEPIFLEYFIPDELEDGKLYISVKYRVAIHKCPCGCGGEVVTPLYDRHGWDLIQKYDNFVTMYPSMENSNFPCKSHYFIRDNKVVWCKDNKVKEEY